VPGSLGAHKGLARFAVPLQQLPLRVGCVAVQLCHGALWVRAGAQ
jgi:hypothetical protein